MSDRNRADAIPPFRSLLRSFAFDPGTLTSHLLAAEPLARIVTQEVGETRDRIFTPLVTLATFRRRVATAFRVQGRRRGADRGDGPGLTHRFQRWPTR